MSYEKSPDYGGKEPTLGGVLLIVFLVVAAVAAMWAWLAVTSPPADAQSAKVIKWDDGDSGDIDGLPFRLADVDSPEKGGVCSRIGAALCDEERELGLKAKTYMEDLTKRGGVSITAKYDIDDDGRQVLDLAVNGEDGEAAAQARAAASMRAETNASTCGGDHITAAFFWKSGKLAGGLDGHGPRPTCC